MTKKGQNNGKKKGNPPKKGGKPEVAKDEEVNCGESFIQIGNIKLSNIDLKGIVRNSDYISMDGNEQQENNPEVLARNPEFMKELEAFATQESQKIIDLSVKHLPCCDSQPSPPPRVVDPQLVIMTKPIQVEPERKVYRRQELLKNAREKLVGREKPAPQEPPKLTSKKSYKKRVFGNSLVCPNGQESPYMDAPPELMVGNTDQMMKVLWKECKSLEDDPIFLQKPDIIAHTILKPNFKRAFQFTLEMHFAGTGMVRHQTYVYTGSDTFVRFRKWFRNKFAEGNNFQMFYQDFDKRYMEVRDDLSLKQLLITHGAYPRGFHCSYTQASAKVLCIPTTSLAQEEIESYMKDSVMGIQSTMMESPNEEFFMRLPKLIAPDLRYREIARRLIHYSDKDLDYPYNQFSSVVQLMMYCQRETTLEEMFSDCRNHDLSVNELKTLLEHRWANPYIGQSEEKSITLEIQAISEKLRKSKYQTRDGMDYAETEMRNLVSEMKNEAAERKINAQIKKKQEAKQAIEEARIAKELCEKRAEEIQRAEREALMPRRHRGHHCLTGFKECTVQRTPNPNAVHIPGLSRVDIPYRHHDTSGFKEVQVQKKPLPTREALEKAHRDQKAEEKKESYESKEKHWTSDIAPNRAGPDPNLSSEELLAQVQEIMAECDSYTKPRVEKELTPLQSHALQKMSEVEEAPLDKSLMEVEGEEPKVVGKVGSPVKAKLKTS